MPKTKTRAKTSVRKSAARRAPPPVSEQAALIRQALAAKDASRVLSAASGEARSRALEAMARAVEAAADDIRFKNDIDVEAGRRAGLSDALIDRLVLTPDRVQAMARGLREIAALPDPVGEVLEDTVRPNGMRLQKVRAPLGVVAIIYESRPNVTVDCAGLCLKSGNAVILRGGKEAADTNQALAHILRNAVAEAGLPREAIQLVESADRSLIRDLVRMDKVVDLVIPRGGEALIQAVRDMATVPVLSHGKGLCAVYVDKAADLDMAEKIAFNAKVQRPGVCNAMETLLVHRDVAKAFIPRIAKRYAEAGVELRADEAARRLTPSAKKASEEDWDREFLDLTAAVRVVDSLEAAVAHINRHGSHHSDAIVSSDAAAAERFLQEVDSAAVLHNASTRLHDGSAFGLGAEMGISTQKMHARGTMGLRELTTTKYIVRGSGQIRE